MKRIIALTIFLFLAPAVNAQQQQLLVITTEPNAIVWVDDIRRGTTDKSGKLTLTKLTSRRHTIRVRANGFKETAVPLVPGRTAITVKLVRTTSEPELAFQKAETARETARDDAARQNAVDLYREAIRLNPTSANAHVGLARVLLDQGKTNDALAEIDAARRARPSYPEASAVEGRIYREAGNTEESIRSFKRAIREGNGFQPEAHVGLARVYEDKGQFAEAAAELRAAIDQLSDSEPVIYQMLGAAYEKLEKKKEAAAAYEKYLKLAPNGSYAAAIRSILDQLKREAAGEQIIP
ncbi:MAG TPA: tetratricopeptide repeat protein [Pyrinomonadaceae bacterium]|nr:tetratricopeptide repeat protein [Pyrinomonadaceae bacterium]